MTRPTFEVADVVREHGDRFLQENKSWLSYQQLRALTAIARCRTAALGGHVDTCSSCHHQAISYNSCRDRHCPKCQAQTRQHWLDARQSELLPVSYFHVVFTLPHELNLLCLYNQRLLYDLLFRNTAATLNEVARNPKHLGADIGFIAILHTWGQNLLLHPHLHCIVPAGGLSPDRTRWIHPRYPFFLPVKVLNEVFRGKFIAGLRRLYRRRQLRLAGPLSSLSSPGEFRTFIRSLYRQNWVVYAKPAFGGPAQVLRYLGRYTHRVAISNHRLLSVTNESVVFRWKDYANGNKHRTMTVSGSEFLRRFVQHVLPRGFVRIRQYGFLSNRSRSKELALARALLSVSSRPCGPVGRPAIGYRCPRCDGPMRMGPQLTSVELGSRCTSFDTS
jgi:hypothetical protein